MRGAPEEPAVVVGILIFVVFLEVRGMDFLFRVSNLRWEAPD